MDKIIFGNPFVKETLDGIILDKFPINSLKGVIPTPYYIFLAQKIRNNIQNLKEKVLKTFDHARLSYSVKANYMDPVLTEVHNQEIPFELISLFEYNILKRNNLNTDNLIVGGPYLPDSLIEVVVQEKNPLFVLYNRDQIRRLQKIAQQQKINVNAILRFVAPKTNGHLGFLPNEITFNQLEVTISKCNNISFRGVHSHYGTQLNSTQIYIKNAQYITEIAHKIQDHSLFKIDILDIGGGLPNIGAL